MNEGELFYAGEDNRPDVQGMRPGAEQGRAGQEVRARPQPRPGEVDTIGANELSFSPDEYLGRIASVRNRMIDQGLSALIVTDPANIYYLTGYNAWSFYTPQLLFVPASGPLTLFMRDMDARGAMHTSWLPPEDIVGYPERYVQRPHIHPFDWVSFALRQRWEVARASSSPVGVEMDSHFFSPRAFRSLVNGVPEWRLVDSFELVNWIRAIKSPAEVALMHKAAEVTTESMNAALATIGDGIAQNEVAAEIAAAQARGRGSAWGDYPAIVPLLPTGESADTPHLSWTNRKFVADESVSIELAGVHRRYHVPLARTAVVGKPKQELIRLEGVVSEALAAVLDVAAPEVPTAELARTWNRVLALAGLEKPSRLGYSIGIGYPPDWGERTISIRTEDDQILEAGMTFHLICGMWMNGYGYELSESVLITDTGCDTFTDFPREIIRV
ncbi:M24 family metallopeptidase [Brevibacterium aurantiacum]|uniref:Xaa-Pro aminopeptidase n=1 Tax=Brevibacterium aurantiacum TaxID=273384 RepID=A0A2H1HNS8_BREAU|nr:M24 family metallopeptidase [Brevibacterium aurantiacum]AOP53984.1 Xaa-Pro aminopeptidase [Brevibacterium aurantiacum]SMX64603.1 Xaa-Pro dipeptidase [Brevibacterium aurantiacum]SMX69137.1 Xaa-Pro dipeptidase [Brevibacterium aurantiacum]